MHTLRGHGVLTAERPPCVFEKQVKTAFVAATTLYAHYAMHDSPTACHADASSDCSWNIYRPLYLHCCLFTKGFAELGLGESQATGTH